MKQLYDQVEIEANNLEADLTDIFAKHGVSRIFVVSGRAYEGSHLQKVIEDLGVEVIPFRGYTSNPKYEEISEGVRLFVGSGAQIMLAVGGGSCIDSAKCIKMYAALDQSNDYMRQDMIASDIPLIAVPTTAGTGSEGNGNIVMYRDGIKKSLHHSSTVPDYVLFDSRYLDNLPDYQKRSTLADAMAQCIESLWAKGRTEESSMYAKEGLRLAISSYERYLEGDLTAFSDIQRAAYLSGRAINISKTTAAHALSYKLSSVCSIPHGHAVWLLLAPVCRTIEFYLDSNINTESDNAQANAELAELAELSDRIRDITDIVCRDDLPSESVLSENITSGNIMATTLSEEIEKIGAFLNLPVPEHPGDEVIRDMVDSVNPERLGNNPVNYTKEQMAGIYRQVFL